MRHLATIIFFLTATTAWSQGSPEPTQTTDNHACADSALGCPVTTQDPLKLAILDRNKDLKPALYRPSPNMPEIVNKTFLRNSIEYANLPDPGRLVKVGYLPKLKIIPCDVGCDGTDYEMTIRRFQMGYRGVAMTEARGDLPIKIRWYHTRSPLERMNPLSSDEFGYSIMLEGKLISIGSRTEPKDYRNAGDLAEVAGRRLATKLLFTLGMGIKPAYLAYDPAQVAQWAVALDQTVFSAFRGLEKLMGRDDVRLQLGPVPLELVPVLSPAIDGILPGEVNPVQTTLIPISDKLF